MTVRGRRMKYKKVLAAGQCSCFIGRYVYRMRFSKEPATAKFKGDDI